MPGQETAEVQGQAFTPSEHVGFIRRFCDCQPSSTRSLRELGLLLLREPGCPADSGLSLRHVQWMSSILSPCRLFFGVGWSGRPPGLYLCRQRAKTEWLLGWEGAEALWAPSAVPPLSWLSVTLSPGSIKCCLLQALSSVLVRRLSPPSPPTHLSI